MKKYSSIRLEITSHCNLECKYCHNSEYSNRTDDLTTNEILNLIRNLKKIFPINKILLTGGEPLLNPDIFIIISEISKLGIKADMVTNGTFLTDENIKKLEEVGLKRIRISIDEVSEKSKIRLKTNPIKIWDIAEKIAKTTKIEVCIHTVCTHLNISQLFDVYLKTLEIGAKRWRVFEVGYQGGTITNKEKFNFDIYYDQLIEYTKQILKHYIFNDLSERLDIEINNIFRTVMLEYKCKGEQIKIDEVLDIRKRLSPCDYVTEHQLSIRSNGIGTLCQYFHNAIFDFKKYDFNIENVLNNKNDVVEEQLIMQDLEYCFNCKYCLVCNSGCRSRASFLTGDIKFPDPVACYIVRRIHDELIPLLPFDTQNVYNSFINLKGLEPKFNRNDLINILRNKGY